MINIRISCWMLLLVSLLPACGSRENRNGISDEEYENTRRALVGANRILVKKDQERIKSFVERMDWNMTESASGLWYQVYENGSGRAAEKGMLISLDYSLSLLDGSQCYSSDSLGIKQFVIGQGGVESGLEEGVLLLREGDRARFVMPPHLAHGLTGDGDRIPPRAIIVYDILVVELESLQDSVMGNNTGL